MRRLRTALLGALIATIAVTAPTAAGNPFAGATTTADGYHTYDSDQINIEGLAQTGAGVYVAVLDTGLVPNWTDYFPRSRVATGLGTGFYQSLTFAQSSEDPCEFIETARGPLRQTNFLSARGSTHGTHVTSTIIGYSYSAKQDALEGYPLPPIQVRGIAPNATIIPVKVLADYTQPPAKGCEEPGVGGQQVFGTDEMVAAGIDYVTSLAEGPLEGSRVVINMSLGDSVPAQVIEDAIDAAIAAGVVVVASAGNDGDAGMGWPGAYAQVISAGASGWTGEWLDADGTTPDNGVRYRVWWLKNVRGTAAVAGDLTSLQPNSGNVVEGPAVADETFVAEFSSWSLDADQDLDVLAPGDWVRGPFAGTPGYNHLPWWSKGWGDVFGRNAGNFYYVGGTSMAAPHVSAVAALMLEADATLTQAQIETIMTSTAVDIGAGAAQVWDPFRVVDGAASPGFVTVTWPANAAGEGLLQADLAVAGALAP